MMAIICGVMRVTLTWKHSIIMRRTWRQYTMWPMTDTSNRCGVDGAVNDVAHYKACTRTFGWCIRATKIYQTIWWPPLIWSIWRQLRKPTHFCAPYAAKCWALKYPIAITWSCIVAWRSSCATFAPPDLGMSIKIFNNWQPSIFYQYPFYRYSQKFYLNNHKLTHSEERKYTCTECGKSFRQCAHLKSHLKTHGIGIKEKFPCTICQKEFLFRGSLREHMWVHKEGTKPFVCTECGKGFLWRNKLELHMKKGH